MLIDVITIFPEMLQQALEYGVLRRALELGVVQITAHDLRDYTTDRHRKVDDYPYGGGAGMVLKPEPLFRAIQALSSDESRVILLTPQGERLTQERVERFSLEEHLILVCGRYKGIDERIREHQIHDEVSIGDYVLSGGELPALVLIDAVVRVLPGAIGDYDSAQDDSFSSGLLDAPHYTRPAVFRSWEVPPVLLSGDHARIARWQRKQSLKRTIERRSDLLEAADLSEEDLQYLNLLQESNYESD